MAADSTSDSPGPNGVVGNADQGTRVLIVDDDPAGLEMLAVALLDSGFTVRTAASAAEALAEARRVPPSLVLVDVMMPEMDGFELCAVLKADPRLGQVPVVLMSAAGGDPVVQERGANVGPAGYLGKPIDLLRLVEVLRQLSTE